jgi:uncharacterized integral membrane protein
MLIPLSADITTTSTYRGGNVILALIGLVFAVIATLDHPVDDFSIPWALPCAVAFFIASWIFDPIVTGFVPRARRG